MLASALPLAKAESDKRHAQETPGCWFGRGDEGSGRHPVIANKANGVTWIIPTANVTPTVAEIKVIGIGVTGHERMRQKCCGGVSAFVTVPRVHQVVCRGVVDTEVGEGEGSGTDRLAQGPSMCSNRKTHSIPRQPPQSR